VYRRIEVTDAGEIGIRERESVPVTAGLARLAVSYCSINRGDIERIRGSYGGVDSTSIPFWRTEGGYFVPGYEPAGTIVEVGPDVDPGLVGRRAVLHSHQSCGTCRYCVAGADNLCGKMRVFGVGTHQLGGWAEEIVVPARQLLTLRDYVDLGGACTYEVTYGTVLHNLRHGLELTTLPGPVAVRGAPGALALAAAQFCVAMTLPCAVIVRAPDSSRVRQLRELLPEVVVVDERDGQAGVRSALGAPPALIIEPLGGRYLAEDVELIARGGAVGVLGSHVGATADIRADLLFLKGVSLYGAPRAPLAEMEEVESLVAQDFVTPQIDRVFDLADVVAALDYCEHPTGLGRVLLAMREAS
jgi:D-arabinose 1-dehydrogenase-like Zn-dependent alcohol dehydrogenase